MDGETWQFVTVPSTPVQQSEPPDVRHQDARPVFQTQRQKGSGRLLHLLDYEVKSSLLPRVAVGAPLEINRWSVSVSLVVLPLGIYLRHSNPSTRTSSTWHAQRKSPTQSLSEYEGRNRKAKPNVWPSIVNYKYCSSPFQTVATFQTVANFDLSSTSMPILEHTKSPTAGSSHF